MSMSKGKIFFTKASEIMGRLDPYFNYHLKNSNLDSVFPEENLYKISKPYSGGTPSKDKPEFWNGEIPWVSPKDFKGLFVETSQDFITKEGLNNSSTKLVPENSILVVVRSGVLAHTLPITINKLPVTINQDIKAFEIKDDRIIPEYLGVYFYVFGDKLLPLITKHSTTVQSINTDQFSKLKIPIPSKDVQEKIINVVMKGFNEKQSKEREADQILGSIDSYLLKEIGVELPNIHNSLKDRIFTTPLSEISGGRMDPKLYDKNTKALKEAIRNSKYETTPLKNLIINSFAGDWGDEIPEVYGNEHEKCLVIRSTEFDNKFNLNLDNSRVKYRLIRKAKVDMVNMEKGDILVEKSGGSPDQPVGRVAFISKDLLEGGKSLFYSNFIQKIKVASNIVYPEYLFSLLKTIHNIKLTDAMQSQTNGIRNLIMKNYYDQLIPLPDFDKQIEIAGHVNNLRKKAKKLQNEGERGLDKAKLEIENIITGYE